MEPSRQLTAYLRPQAARAVGGFLCVVGYIAGSLYTPVLLRRLIDGLGQGTLDQAGLLRLLGALGGLGVFSFFVAIGMRRLLLGLANHVEHAISARSVRPPDRHGPGVLPARAHRRPDDQDVVRPQAVREMIGQGLLQGSRMVVGFPLAFGVMFATNTQLALMVTALLPFVSILFFFLMRLVRKYYERAQDQFSTDLQLRPGVLLRHPHHQGLRHRGAPARAVPRPERGVHPAQHDPDPHRGAGVAVYDVPLLGGRHAAAAHRRPANRCCGRPADIGTYVQFQQYLIFLQWPMLALGWTVNLLQRGLASWRRIRTILDARLKPEVADPPGASPTPANSNACGDIEFRGVRLRRGGSCCWTASTCASPPASAWPSPAPPAAARPCSSPCWSACSIPTRARSPSADATCAPGPADLRRAIGLAPQEPFLFSDTLANNLALGWSPGG
jgi:ATP-binding cassette subfamily B multidrug efflux pump